MEEWEALKAKIKGSLVRHRVSSFMRFCSANGIKPGEVTESVVGRFIDYRSRCGVTPAELKLDVCYTNLLHTFFRGDEDLHRTLLERLSDILLDARQFPNFVPGKVTDDRHDKQFAAKSFGEIGRDFHRALRASRAIGRHHNIVHCDPTETSTITMHGGPSGRLI
jgi:hypothetical protein